MTYTVIGRCPRTNEIGIGLATYSVAFGSFMQGAHNTHGIAMSQANGRRRNASLAKNLMQQGFSSSSVLKALVQDDRDEDLRQIAVMTRDGLGSVHTGARVQGWAGSRIGANYIVFGNVIAGEHVLASMEESFYENAALPLVERLISSLEAGRDAGGQSFDGRHMPERSASVIVMGQKSYAAWDLRVDLHKTAVDELRRIYSLYSPYQPFYEDREETPSSCMPQLAWENQHLTEAHRWECAVPNHH